MRLDQDKVGSCVRRHDGVALAFLLVGLPLVNGCRTLDQSPFQNFAASAEKLNSSAAAAYDLLAKTDTQRQRERLVSSPLPPYAPANRSILRGRTHISDESLRERLKVTAGLVAYARGLANLASGPAQQRFDTSTAGLVQALKAFNSSDVTNLFGSNLAQNLPTGEQIDAFAGAIKFLGDLIIQAQTKHALKNVLDQGTRPILCVTTNLENDVGTAVTTQGRPAEGMRGYFDAYFDRLLVDQFGQEQITTDNGTTVRWADLGRPQREQIVQNATALVEQQQTTDQMLVALRDSYAKFREAHEALKGVVNQSQQFSLTSALAAFNEAAQHLDELVTALNLKAARK